MQVRGQTSSRTAGFTLIEVVVALGIFSVGVLALIHAQTENLTASGEVRDRVIADIVAENQLVESYLNTDVAGLRSDAGEINMVGRNWFWTRQVSSTDNPLIARIEINVKRNPDDQTLSSIVAFRGVK